MTTALQRRRRVRARLAHASVESLEPRTHLSGQPFRPLAAGQIIQAEDFDLGGEGVAYHDLDAANRSPSNYRPGEAIDLGSNGISNVVTFTAAGEWLEYTVNVPATAHYAFTTRIANNSAGAQIHYDVDGVDITGPIDVPNTGAFGSYESVPTAGFPLAAGTHVIRLAMDRGATEHGAVGNIDWLRIDRAPDPPTAQAPFLGRPFVAGETIQMEDFDIGGEGEAYHDTTVGGGGTYRPGEGVDIGGGGSGRVIGSVIAGEWLEYTIRVEDAGQYHFTIAAANGGDGINEVFFDFPSLGRETETEVFIPTMGSYGTYREFAGGVTDLPAGTHVVRLGMHTSSGVGLGNFDYFRFERVTEPPTPVPNLRVVHITPDSISIAWGTVPTARSYQVFRDGVLLGEVANNRNVGGSFNISDLRPQTNYTVTVRAVNAIGQSPDATTTARTADDPQQPFGGIAGVPNQTIEAENFDTGGEGLAFHDIDPENRGGSSYRFNAPVDIGGGGGNLVVGYTAAGEWLEYTVDIPAAGNYRIDTRLANNAAGAFFHYDLDGQGLTGPIPVPNTGSFGTLVTVQSGTFQLPAGRHVLRLAMDQGAANGAIANFDSFSIVPLNPQSPAQAPFLGAPFSVGSLIQVEDFDAGGEGVAYHDFDAPNNGGQYRNESVDIGFGGGGLVVGFTRSGEWMEYTLDVAAAGAYIITTRVAHNSEGSTFNYTIDGVDATGAIRVPNTQSFGEFHQVRSFSFDLAAGRHVVRLSVDPGLANFAAGNFDWFRIDPAGPATPRAPFSGAPALATNMIQAEHFDAGGENVAYHDAEPANLGNSTLRPSEGVDLSTGGTGIVLSNTRPGEWVGYTLFVPTTREYVVQLSVATPSGSSAGSSSRIDISADGARIGSATGGFDKFKTVITEPFTLAAGVHDIRLQFPHASLAGDVPHVDWFRLVEYGEAPTHLHILTTSSNSVELAWDSHPAISNYEVYRNGQRIATLANAPDSANRVRFDDRSLTPNTTYEYIVRAKLTNDRLSPPSNAVRVTTPFAAGPFFGTFVPFGAIVQAENYDHGGEGFAYHDADPVNHGGQYRADGVDIGYGGTGLVVGYTAPGEWIEYSLGTGNPGFYQVQIAVSNIAPGGEIDVYLDGALIGTVAVPNTGSWSNFVVVATDPVNMFGGLFRLHFRKAASNGAVANVDWLRLVRPVTSQPDQRPFLGTPFNVGSLIQAEDFDTGGEATAYHDDDLVNTPALYRTGGVDIGNGGTGLVVGYTAPLEWLEYTIEAPGDGTRYVLEASVSNPAPGGIFGFNIAGSSYPGVNIPNTGSWDAFATLRSTPFQLTSGISILRILMIKAASNGAVGNFDWFRIVPL